MFISKCCGDLPRVSHKQQNIKLIIFYFQILNRHIDTSRIYYQQEMALLIKTGNGMSSFPGEPRDLHQFDARMNTMILTVLK